MPRAFVFLALLGMMGGCSQAAVAQKPTAEEIVRRLVAHDRERGAELASYVSERRYHLTYHGPIGERVADMTARMEFTAPDRKRFTVVSQSGSTLLCKQVLQKLMDAEREGATEAAHVKSMLSVENDTVKLVGEETLNGTKAWVLDVAPKHESKLNYKGRVWISQDEYAILKIDGAPAKNPTMLSSQVKFVYLYGKHGAFYLPERSETDSKLRIGGQVRLTVEYATRDVVEAVPGQLAAAGR